MGQLRLKNASGRTSKVGQQVKLAPNSKTSFVIAELGDFGVIGTVAQSCPNGYSGLINLIGHVNYNDIIGAPIVIFSPTEPLNPALNTLWVQIETRPST